MKAITKSLLWNFTAIGCMLTSAITREVWFVVPMIFALYNATLFYIDHKFEELSK